MVLFSCVQDAPTNLPPPVRGPNVSIVSPANNAVVRDTTTVEVEATSDKGVSRVEIYIDYRIDTSRIFFSKPYRWRWDARTLVDSTYHKVNVIAYDGEGTQTASPLVSVLVRVTNTPAAPSGLNIVLMNSSSVTLSWQDNSDFETAFDLLMSTDEERNYVTVKSVSANQTSAALQGSFSSSVAYIFRVRARSGSNLGGRSNGVRAANYPGLYAGGMFSTAGGSGAANIARWDGSSWRDVGGGMNGEVRALSSFSGELYAGGSFSSAGGVPVNNIARWNGRSWSAVAAGVNGTVYALAAYATLVSDNLFVGGVFTSAGGLPAMRIAKWSGTSWSPVSTGVDYPSGSFRRNQANESLIQIAVFSLSASAQLVVGGRFTVAGGLDAHNVALTDGENFRPLGEGMDGPVYTVKSFPVACGDFDNADGLPVNNVAIWNSRTRPTQWDSIGRGTSGPVYACADAAGSGFFVGGNFTGAGDTTANYVARWDGAAWSEAGGGANGPVRTFVIFDNALYMGGDFTIAGGVPAGSVARWDGSTWLPVGSGTDGSVNALAGFSYWDWSVVP